MKINHNMSAVTANNQLLKTENSLSSIMERLSSGLKLNHAKDNPAGMAISHKMKTQIEGLNRANNNASDGSAVIEIADGALNEVTEMIQRIRELCVQAANDTNCDDDKAAIQNEISELKEEINRVSTHTEYNTMKLLDGSQNSRVYSNQVSRLSVSKYVDEGDYSLTIDKEAKQAEVTGGTVAGPYSGKSGNLSINGYLVPIENGDSADTIYEKLRKGAEKGECIISKKGDPIELKSTAFGKDAVVSISGDADVLTFLGMTDNSASPAYGEDAEITLGTGFSDKATVKYEGNKMTVSDAGGFEMSFYAAKTHYVIDPTTKKSTDQWEEPIPAGTKVDIEVTDIGNMSLQIGANQHQTMAVEIPKIDCEMMYIDDLDVTTVTGADRGIAAADRAIAYVDAARSRLGAYENRLEHTMADLSASSENMTKALSTLSDADMAEEMVNYTTYNVLNQAGVSVLSQANDLPQTVLQLLQ